MACCLAASSHYLNQCWNWNIVNLTLRNKLQWNIGNSNIFIQENACENVVCEMAAILSRPQCVKMPQQTPLDHVGELWCIIPWHFCQPEENHPYFSDSHQKVSEQRRFFCTGGNTLRGSSGGGQCIRKKYPINIWCEKKWNHNNCQHDREIKYGLV